MFSNEPNTDNFSFTREFSFSQRAASDLCRDWASQWFTLSRLVGSAVGDLTPVQLCLRVVRPMIDSATKMKPLWPSKSWTTRNGLKLVQWWSFILPWTQKPWRRVGVSMFSQMLTRPSRASLDTATGASTWWVDLHFVGIPVSWVMSTTGWSVRMHGAPGNPCLLGIIKRCQLAKSLSAWLGVLRLFHLPLTSVSLRPMETRRYLSGEIVSPRSKGGVSISECTTSSRFTRNSMGKMIGVAMHLKMIGVAMHLKMIWVAMQLIICNQRWKTWTMMMLLPYQRMKNGEGPWKVDMSDCQRQLAKVEMLTVTWSWRSQPPASHVPTQRLTLKVTMRLQWNHVQNTPLSGLPESQMEKSPRWHLLRES